MPGGPNPPLAKHNEKRARKQERERRVEWIDGFSLRLTIEEKEFIKKDLEEGTMDILTILAELTEVGIKTSIGYDRKANAYAVTLYRNHPEYADAGYSLTSRASTIERCFAGLLYALAEVNDFNIVSIAAAREQAETDF